MSKLRCFRQVFFFAENPAVENGGKPIGGFCGKEKQRKSKYKSVKRIISVIFEENLFSLFLRVFCVFTYFFVIFVPRLSPRGTVRDKKLSPEKKGQIARSI